jgi:hypothetical protein
VVLRDPKPAEIEPAAEVHSIERDWTEERVAA